MLCLGGNLQRVLMHTLQLLETCKISRPGIAEDQSDFQELKDYLNRKCSNRVVMAAHPLPPWLRKFLPSFFFFLLWMSSSS